MRNTCRFLTIGLATCLLGACSMEPGAQSEPDGGVRAPANAQELARAMLDAMGGRSALAAVDSIVMRGNGTRTRMGQIAETGGTDPTGRLVDATESIDLANGRAAFDYGIENGDFMQHRTEVYTTFDGRPVGWATGEGRPNIATSPNGLFSWATQNSPEMLLRRNVITVALAMANSAQLSETPELQSFNGRMSLHTNAQLPSGEPIDVFIDPETSLLDGFRALDTETMLGDVQADYIYTDYRSVDGLTLPYSLVINKQDRPYSSIDYESIALNDPAALKIFDVPADIVDQARQVVASDESWVPLQWNRVADKVYHAVAYSHHSMVVEFPSFVVVIEGPYTEAQGLTLAKRIDAEIGKPIRYVVPTHPHYDHTGGIRALASVGATVLVAHGHEAELRGIVESPHTNPPDALALAESAGAEVGQIEVFSGMTTIEEGAQRVELYEVDTIPHVKPKTLAYVPSVGALFQSDLFFGGPSPDAIALNAAVITRGLDVKVVVGGHGGTWPGSALAAVGTGAP